MYRVTALAWAALKAIGVKNPRDHLIIARLLPEHGFGGHDDAVPNATILVSKNPFSHEDVRIIEDVCKRMKFEVVLTPTTAVDPGFALVASQDVEDSAHPLFSVVNISPPTDDKPFFYNLMRLGDIFNPDAWAHGGTRQNLRALFILGSLLLTVLVLTFLCIVFPLMVRARAVSLKGTFPFFLFFGAIGLGFMLIEISQMHRLNIFLGHPVYGLSVVLFSLLLSSGLGSYLTSTFSRSGATASAALPLLFAVIALVLFGIVTPFAVTAARHAETPVRIAITVAMLFPIGIFMGMAFPLGMGLASGRFPQLMPWLWGMNGATSVCGSVLTFVIVLFYGISAALWLGAACYAVACGSFLWALRGREKSQTA